MIRKLAIAGALLLALGAGADVLAQRAAESAIAATASETFGLDGAVEVDVEGFPVLLDIAQGRLDAVTATLAEQRIDDLQLRRVGVRLEDLRAEGSLFGDGPLTIESARTNLLAETDQAAVNAFLERRGEDARVELLDGRVRVTARRSVLGSSRRFVATGPLRIEGTELVFRPDEVTWDGPSFPGAETLARELTTVRQQLPRPPGGVAVQRVVVEPGLLRLEGSAQGRSFQVRN